MCGAAAGGPSCPPSLPNPTCAATARTSPPTHAPPRSCLCGCSQVARHATARGSGHVSSCSRHILPSHSPRQITQTHLCCRSPLLHTHAPPHSRICGCSQVARRAAPCGSGHASSCSRPALSQAACQGSGLPGKAQDGCLVGEGCREGREGWWQGNELLWLGGLGRGAAGSEGPAGEGCGLLGKP